MAWETAQSTASDQNGNRVAEIDGKWVPIKDSARNARGEIQVVRQDEEIKPDGNFQGSLPGRIIQGGRDVLDSGAQILSKVVPDGIEQKINQANNYLADKTGLVGRLDDRGVTGQIQDNEAQYQDARKRAGDTGIDGGRIAGNVAATLPLVAGKGLQLAKGMDVFNKANIAKGAGQGAIVGGAQPVLEGDFAEEKLKQVGTGAVGGAVATPVGAMASRVVKPQTSPQVKTLMNEGVTPTPGQIIGGGAEKLEDKLMSLPIMGDAISHSRKAGQRELNRAAFKRALTDTGVDASKLPVGPEGLKQVKTALNKQYDAIIPKVTFKSDKQFATEIANLRDMAKNMAPKEARRFEQLVDDAMGRLSPNGRMIGESFKKVESKLIKEAEKFKGSTDAYQRELGDAISEVRYTMKGALYRANPDYEKALKVADRNYANYVRLREAGAKATDMSDGFTPSQLANAVKKSDKSVGKGSTATGDALMQDLSGAGVNVMNSKIPNSGTTDRLLLGSGAIGAGAYGVPGMEAAIAALSAGSIPYLARKTTAAALTKRPPGSKALADALQKVSPLALPAAIGQNQ